MQPPLSTAIKDMFGLDYAEYDVLPRVLLQSMPAALQEDYVRFRTAFEEMFRHIPQPRDYKVSTGEWRDIDDCSAGQLTAAGITRNDDGNTWTYSDGQRELTGSDTVFIPAPNPLPNYRHHTVDHRR